MSRLLAFVDSDYDETALEGLRRVAEGLAPRRDWLLGAPEFVDAVDEHGVRTVGIVHHIYGAYDETGARLDAKTDRAHLDETREIVEHVRRYSAQSGVDLGFELDDESVGWVESGRLTRSLEVGFLGEWAARFEGR